MTVVGPAPQVHSLQLYKARFLCATKDALSKNSFRDRRNGDQYLNLNYGKIIIMGSSDEQRLVIKLHNRIVFSNP
jgi:hypothetical protein